MVAIFVMFQNFSIVIVSMSGMCKGIFFFTHVESGRHWKWTDLKYIVLAYSQRPTTNDNDSKKNRLGTHTLMPCGSHEQQNNSFPPSRIFIDQFGVIQSEGTTNKQILNSIRVGFAYFFVNSHHSNFGRMLMRCRFSAAYDINTCIFPGGKKLRFHVFFSFWFVLIVSLVSVHLHVNILLSWKIWIEIVLVEMNWGCFASFSFQNQ